ncbi:MAG: TasA family protein [Acidimicrobiales bacterium]
MRARQLSTKLLLSIGAMGTTAALAGLGTFATFTSTTSASQPITAGTVTIALGSTGAVTNRLTLSATGVVPGDTIQRAFDLTNSGNQNLASAALTTTATVSSLLDTDATNGLQMVVDKCSTAWTEGGVSPAFTYTCGGSLTTPIASRAAIGSNLALGSINALTAGGTDHMRVTLTLPSGAGNTLQGLTSTIQYAFTGTQRAATNQ